MDAINTRSTRRMERETESPVIAVNAAFLQEIKEVNEELWQCLAATGRLCEHTQWEPRTCRLLIDRLRELLDLLALHFALEEAYGYFEGPAVVDARLNQRAGRLRDEHRTLFVTLQSVVDAAEKKLVRDNPDDAIQRIVVRFRAFQDQLREHESRENELILEAFNDDVGVGD
jgi:hypothetical protein